MLQDICYYWYFLDKAFTFEPYVCNGCHDVLVVSVNLSNIAILNINGADYLCSINKISKISTLNLPANANLTKKLGVL